MKKKEKVREVDKKSGDTICMRASIEQQGATQKRMTRRNSMMKSQGKNISNLPSSPAKKIRTTTHRLCLKEQWLTQGVCFLMQTPSSFTASHPAGMEESLVNVENFENILFAFQQDNHGVFQNCK
jgi:hypothetical protein